MTDIMPPLVVPCTSDWPLAAVCISIFAAFAFVVWASTRPS